MANDCFCLKEPVLERRVNELVVDEKASSSDEVDEKGEGSAGVDDIDEEKDVPV